MIKIKKLHIKRFRSIMDLKLEIDQDNNFITVCGENNAGKTNTFRAMNIFFNPSEYNYKKDTPFHKLEGTQGGSVYPNIIVEFEEGSKTTIIERNFEKNEFSLLGKEVSSDSSEKQLDTKQCEVFLKKVNFFYIESINVSYPKLINNLIDTVFEVAFAKTRFSGGKKALKEAYEKYTEGLLEVLQTLSNEINPLFQEYKDNWQVEFNLESDIKKFRDIITDDIEFVINDSSNKHIESKGSGLQRLAYILLHFKIIEKLKNTILLIDEPDIFLHQSLQKTLNSHMQIVKEKSQIFVTTHSPVFIDSYTLNNVFLLDLEITEKYYKRRNRDYNELKTKLVDISGINGDHKIKRYLGLDNKDFDLLSKYNILVEGESDIKYLTELAKFFKFNIPNFIPLGGADSAERTLQFYNNFYHGIDFKPNIILLLDNDSKGREIFGKVNKKLQQYPNLRINVEYVPNFLGNATESKDKNNEIEDFVYPEIIIELVNKILQKKSMTKINSKQIATKISKPAFTNSGILQLIDNEKNEKNQETGHMISISSENVKKSMSNLFNIEGSSKFIKLVEEGNIQYPEVKRYIKKLCEEW
ncbi:AAA family ATPase [Aliarcobacter skirrowii]|uniref:ATP-dependent nuclease n=1 Tax=Aliarcobacter skirrowii TaxID=28200 RepID=UPI0029BA7217|nr:AAA family ATPase [Aliarcobacter skirrowii]MDX4057359.1 AAA family ATPase [Aliarcobacter skirrowii]